MLKSVLLGVLLTSTIGVTAQDTLLVHGSAPDLYLTHTVKKGENWYSLGRSYGLSPKDIAAKNKMQMDQGLSLGKQISIPLSKNNFIQSKDAQNGAGLRPVYHKVAEKETLYRIHVRYDKVPLDNVRQWNRFTGDGVQKDAYLIVGFVKGNGQSAVLASAPAPVPAPPAARTEPAIEPAAKPVAKTQPAEPETTKPVVVKSQPAEPETKPVPRSQTAEPETKPVAEAPRETSVGRTPSIPEGGFEQIYQQQTNNGRSVVTEKGPGTWFRSNAVVGSGKYYALHNTAPRGTIVKVTNPLTGRSIYAKVLDAIPQLKSNANLIIKLSDAAQDALGINEGRFYCELSYDEK
ncbi:LysM peptidoglycan-binding domain-containing protein [Chitinophaga lutea]|uniref:LysM peptidoglycan-binding domain-containing protein n=1 Tax=Chitinophaga lutea TaxID=2488634 RepID=A0A3N4PMD6_9BACT|nr:LysM peptidoglycan-binding domain-containing protein [Chitinophaga lutea]RPE09356.1 LysM peptidoglycan-binding domain-containing protein [Chitinophaga lutea]